jgi:multidrug efflux pump subunit AcrA (membrane-fusion protein)
LAETSTDVAVPVGITITDVYVHAGDTVVAGDVLAAVDADSVSEAIDAVDEEIDALAEALASLGESATLDRVIAAYGGLLDDLNAIYSSGYITADASGTIGSVNVKKGDTVTVNTGSSSSSADTSSGSSGPSNSSAVMPTSYATLDGVASGDSVRGNMSDSVRGNVSDRANSVVTAGFVVAAVTSPEMPGPREDGGIGGTGTSGTDGTDGTGDADTGGNTGGNASGTGGTGTGGVDGQTDYLLDALPYATATVSQASAACAASATATREEATRAYLINLCEAKAWSTGDPATPTAVNVDYGSFAPVKGVYPVVFSSSDDPTVTKTTYVVLDDDTGTNGANTGGTGNDVGASGGTNTGAGANPSGSGATGGSTGSATAQDTTTEETALDSAKVAAFQIYSDAEVEVQLQLDEADVAAVKVGQQATVELSALEGQMFEGTVSSVSVTSGSYYAVITIPKVEDMYAGFSATATIVKEQATNAVIIPLDAVQQRGTELFVYTTATEDGELGGETLIETGLSDESTVEVISGLSEGTTVYYQQRVTTAAASTGTSGFGQNQGGREGGFSSGGGLGGGGQMPNFGGGGNGPVQIPG